jgi:hypothetical protein
MLDYQYVTASSVRAYEDGAPPPYQRLMVTIDQSSDNHVAVEWALLLTPSEARARAPGPSEGGVLLFEPTQDCWRLTEDRRDLRPAGVEVPGD